MLRFLYDKKSFVGLVFNSMYNSPPHYILFVCKVFCNNRSINHGHPVLYKLISCSFTPQSDPELPFLFLPLTSDLKLKEFRGEKEIL